MPQQPTRIAVIGAGSFVFGPGVLRDALVRRKLQNVELAMMDVSREMLLAMAAVTRRVADDLQLDVRVTETTDRREALDGASYVLCCAAPQLRQRFETDCRVMAEQDADLLVTEFGGVAGISYSLRQIAFMRDLACDMKETCPDAMFLTVSNPLPRVCQAMHEDGIRTVGFCSAALEGYAMVHRLLEGGRISHPFTEARERWDVTFGGLNHFSWAVKIRDRNTGEDLLPALREKLAAGGTSGWQLGDDMLRETGYLLVPNDHHTQDFLPPREGATNRGHSSHGSADEVNRRVGMLRQIAEGSKPYRPLVEGGSWERPMDLVAALLGACQTDFDAVNTVNTGQIPQLPEGVFVETPAAASAEGLVIETVQIPETVQPYLQDAARQTDRIVRAARTRDRALVHECIEEDPTVLNKPAGHDAIDACMQAHRDVIGEFS